MAVGFTAGGLSWTAPGPEHSESPFVAGETSAWERNGSHMDWDDSGWVAMFAVMAVFWLGALALGVWAVATYARRGERSGPETPVEIARRRYASGEISFEEFEAIRRNLEGRGS